MRDKSAIVVPTLNAGELFQPWLEAVNSQTVQPDRCLLVDSGSSDGTPELAESVGFEVLRIAKATFDHGGTRLMAAQHLENTDILVYLTQDAILADRNSLGNLLQSFSDPEVASVYGRQLPADNASKLAAHHRRYNYSGDSYCVDASQLKNMGIRGLFCSNSFAAYRREPLINCGGFPEKLIMGEDMLAVKALLDHGYRHMYNASATVKHSHNYTYFREFRRYFDTGVFHSLQPDIRALFRSTMKEGGGFVRSELEYALKDGISLFAESVFRNACRVAGYYLGLAHNFTPVGVNRFFSNSPAFWRRERE